MSQPTELYASVHAFLVKNGLQETAKKLLQDAKLDAKKLSTGQSNDLVEMFQSFKAKRPLNGDAPVDPSLKKVKFAGKKDDSSDSDSDSDSSEDEAPAKKPAAAPAKKVVPAPTPAKKVAAKKDDSSSSSDSDSDSSEDEAPAKKPAAAPAKKAAPAPTPAPTPAKKVAAKKDDSSSSSDSDSDSDSSEDEAPAKKPAAAPAKKAAPAPTPAPTPAKKVAAKKDDSSSSSDSDSDSDSDDEPPAKKPAAAPASAAKPAASSGDDRSHKIYVKGLPWKTTEKELSDFFKSCGKINAVEIPLEADGRSTGTAYIFFSKRSELEAALELDGQTWPGTERWLKILEGVDKPERKSFGGPKPEGCDTVFVGNLPWDVTEEQVNELFGTVGEVAQVRFATGEDGSFRGFGHVQFSNGDDTEAAVTKLQGALINGKALRLDYAPPRNRDSFGGGRGGGRGDGGRGGRDGGRGRGRDSGRGGRGGRGAASPGINKAKGTIAAGSGKKTTFDEE